MKFADIKRRACFKMNGTLWRKVDDESATMLGLPNRKFTFEPDEEVNVEPEFEFDDVGPRGVAFTNKQSQVLHNESDRNPDLIEMFNSEHQT